MRYFPVCISEIPRPDSLELTMKRLATSILLLPLTLFLLSSCIGGDSSPTDAPVDETAPTVVSTSITDGATDVALDVIIQFVFSEAMDPSSVVGQVSSTVGGFVTLNWLDDRTLTVELEFLQPDAAVSIFLDTGLSDLAGNGLAELFELGFTTVTGTPVLLEQSPADGAVDVPRNTQIRLRFSFDMDLASMESATTVESTPTALATDLEFDYLPGVDGWITLTFPDPLPEMSLISVAIGTGAYSADFGIFLEDPIAFSFTTSDQLDGTPPTLLGMEPANGSVVPASTASVTFTFSEPIDPLSLHQTGASAAISVLVAQAGLEPSWSGDFTQVTLPLPTPLPAGLPMAISFGSFADVAGNVQTTPIDYRIDVEGEGDPWPFLDGSRFHFVGTETVTPTGGIPYEDSFDGFFQVEVQPGGDIHWAEYDWEDYVDSSGHDIFRKTAATLELTGWYFDTDEGADEGSVNPPVLFAKFPFAVQSWSGSSAVSTSDGDFSVDYEMAVVGRADLPAAFGEDGVTLTWLDCWQVTQSISLLDGGQEFASEEITVWYAPSVGVVKRDAMEFEEEETVHLVEELTNFSY
jgi:hypothetical protein